MGTGHRRSDIGCGFRQRHTALLAQCKLLDGDTADPNAEAIDKRTGQFAKVLAEDVGREIQVNANLNAAEARPTYIVDSYCDRPIRCMPIR